MRLLAVLPCLALATAGCGSHAPAMAHRGSLAKLTRLTEERNAFGVVLDAKTGKALTAFRVDNPIRAAAPDGDGGWYIGGGFVHVDGRLRKRLAHVRADGALDPDWRPEANGNGVSVTSLARIGSRLYVGGDFARLDHRERLHLGAVDTHTGELLSWRPPPDAPRSYPVLHTTNGRVFVGGYAGTPGDSGLVALDPETGQRDRGWHGLVEGGSVRMVAKVRRRLYLAGMFTSVDGVPRPGLAAVELRTGALARNWKPPLESKFCVGCSDVTALAAGKDAVYVALPGALAALDADSGALVRRWKPRLYLTTGIYGGANVAAMARAGDLLYVAGTFDRVQRAKRVGVAALDLATAQPAPSWVPHANGVNGSLVVRSRSRVLVGIELFRAVQLEVAGLEAAKQPLERLDLVLALSGKGSVRIGLGTNCDRERWAETGRCTRPVSRWLETVRFPRAMRTRWTYRLDVPPGHYFVRFVARADGRPPQPPSDVDFRAD